MEMNTIYGIIGITTILTVGGLTNLASYQALMYASTYESAKFLKDPSLTKIEKLNEIKKRTSHSTKGKLLYHINNLGIRFALNKLEKNLA